MREGYREKEGRREIDREKKQTVARLDVYISIDREGERESCFAILMFVD